MFDQMKTMGALAGLLKNKEKLREAGDRFRENVERISVTGTAGGSAVRVTVSGKLRVTDVQIDPAAITGLGHGESGRDMVQSLVKDAINDAMERVQQLIAEEARRRAEELGLPDLPLDRLIG